jgi:MFS family permease
MFMAMTEPSGVSTPAEEAAFAAIQPVIPAPTARAKFRVIATMVLARLGLMTALGAPLAAGLVLKLQSLVPQSQVVGTLGLITSLGALSALIFDPIFGRLSDNTKGRFGRRRPWLILGSAALAVALVGMALSPSVWLLGLFWILGQMLGNAAVSAHTASIADQLPPVQRGKVSGAIGIAQQAATYVAAFTASLFPQQLLLLFLVPGLIGFVLVTVFALVLPDKELPHRPRRDTGILLAVKTFWVSPRKHPDFAWAWASRFLLVLANFMFTTFRLLWIQHDLGLTPAKATQVMATGVLCYTISLIVSGQIAGWISDKIHRRKLFIVASAIIFGLGMLTLSFASDPMHFYLAEIVLGIGFGVYVSVDLALVIDVLPNPDEAAKDLGVFNIAMTAPQVLAPGAAALLIGIGGSQNYDVMLIGATIIALVGAALIIPVRSVR